jgi:NADH-quinone oxidoreductase subunit E
MADSNNDQCSRNCWWMAAAGGVLLAILLLAVGNFGFVSSILFGVIFAVILGFFLRWAFCSGSGDAVVAPPMPKAVEKVVPAPEPAAAASVEPVAAAAAVPVAKASAPAAKPAPKSAPKPAAKSKPAATPKAKSSATKTGAVKKATKPKASTASALDAALAKSKDAPDTATPEMLAAPRGGKADDLKMIKGVGPALEKLLNEEGVWHYDQVASWKAKDIAFVDAKMARFSGRIARDEWVKQAKILAKGGATEFSARASKGDMY